jgi:hypothetical protein
MFNQPFAHKTIRNMVITFGALFSNVKIIRQKADGTAGQIVRVPIVYGPKEKIFVRLREDPSLNNQVNVTLPRMAFEIVSYSYAADRNPNKHNKVICHNEDGSIKATFTPVPWNLSIRLVLLTKGTEDGLDVIEQILPSFAPQYVATVSTIPEMNVTQDVPFILNSVHVDDNYEGEFATRRLVETTFDFTAQVSLYGGTSTGNIITRTDTSILTNPNFVDELAHHTSEGDPSTGEITVDFWE